MSGFASALRTRLEELKKLPEKALRAAAPRIQQRLRDDARTRRGNVPQFAPGAEGHRGPAIPITVTAGRNGLEIEAPKWVIRKAIERGQPKMWARIAREAATQQSKRGR